MIPASPPVPDQRRATAILPGVRIALTSPYGHPHVRRGAERYCRELAVWLGAQGHDVTWVVSSRDLTGAQRQDDGVLIDYRRRGPERGAGPIRLDDPIRVVLPIGRGVRAGRYDVAECHHVGDAAGTRLLGRVPYVAWVPGAPRTWSVRRRPLHARLIQYAFAGAARVHALSTFAAGVLESEFGYRADVFAPGVDTARYAGARPETEGPVLLCTAAAGDPRKRVELLVRAFPAVLAEHPTARLVLNSGDLGASSALVDLLEPAERAQVDLQDPRDFDAVADAYRAATVSVLPSVEEAFGLVLVESMAAGTPVVGARSGAIPEVLDDDSVGRLFEPDDQRALERALLEVIEISSDPHTAGACRAHAARWDWSQVGPPVEAVYAAISD